MKKDIVTFKVDSELAHQINMLPNKSEFIRQALLTALDNICPVCQGTGCLTPAQMRHWRDFSHHHNLEKCDDCNAVHLHCDFENHTVVPDSHQ